MPAHRERNLRIIGEATISSPEIRADGQPDGNARFSLVGYTGASIRQWWSRVPLVVDLAGMDTSDLIAVMLGHQYDMDHAVGQASEVKNDGKVLVVAGDVIGEGEEVEKALRLARRGWKFQASIGADVNRIERVEQGAKVKVNGRTFEGPVDVVRASTLREVSIVLFGADSKTSAAIAAEANGDDPMAKNANQTPDETDVSAEAPAKVAAGKDSILPGVNAKTGGDGASLVEEGSVSAEAIAQLRASLRDEVKAEVIAEVRKEVLGKIRGGRPDAPGQAPAGIVRGDDQSDGDTVQAALCLRGGLRNIEKQFSERTLEAAAKMNREGFGLQECLVQAARANGYTGSSRVRKENLREVLRFAYIQGSATHDISDVLSGVYGKHLLDGFFSVEPGWNAIARERNVSDFKEVTGVRVVGGFEYEEVGNDGELASADVGDEKRTVKAKTYGRLSSITRQDIINDDLDALSDIPRHLGRGAGLKLNTEFWTEYQANNATYYAKRTAHADNAFSLTSLELAVTDWRKLKGPDNQPLGIMPKLLVLPPELEIKAAKIMGSDLLITGKDVTEGNRNPFAGRYQLVVSSYLTSATTWWLGADPRDLPAMVVAFLDGIKQPTVESADADFSKLAIQMRGFFDFGVAKGESKGVYRMATA
jgi:hypothetical protein